VRTLVSLRESVCPFCGRPYQDEYRLDATRETPRP
jgi:hypothetical protein